MNSQSKVKSAVSGFDSFDENDVDDSSGVRQMAPVAPNDYMMHISSCSNAKCLMKNAWINMENERRRMKTPDGGMELENQFVRFHPCLKCQNKAIPYCSQRCRQIDWFNSHQFTCEA